YIQPRSRRPPFITNSWSPRLSTTSRLGVQVKDVYVGQDSSSREEQAFSFQVTGQLNKCTTDKAYQHVGKLQGGIGPPHISRRLSVPTCWIRTSSEATLLGSHWRVSSHCRPVKSAHGETGKCRRKLEYHSDVHFLHHIRKSSEKIPSAQDTAIHEAQSL
ncbi:hypothetical protein L218DRAFT_983322, partial [Marasmius fiardii PR-910]